MDKQFTEILIDTLMKQLEESQRLNRRLIEHIQKDSNEEESKVYLNFEN